MSVCLKHTWDQGREEYKAAAYAAPPTDHDPDIECKCTKIFSRVAGGRKRSQVVGSPWELPSQIYAVLGQKQPFFAQNSPQTRAKRPNEGKRWLHSTCMSLPRVKEPSRAHQLHDVSEKRPKKAPKSPKICAICTNTPKPSTGRILGYVAQNPIPRAPSPPAPLFVVSKPQNRPTSHLDPRTGGHLV